MADPKKELESALKAAELRIANYTPPSMPDPSGTASGTIDMNAVKEEFAAKAAQELTNAVFDIFVKMIQDGAKKEIDTQQIVQRLNTIQTELTSIRAILTRNRLT